MSEISDSIITEYNKNPVNFFEMKDFTVSHHEWNFICWDDITVYLKIKDNVIENFSFSWNPGQVTTASCSLLAEMIEWKTIDEVMQIQKEGHEKREAAELELRRIENQLTDKLLQINNDRDVTKR